MPVLEDLDIKSLKKLAGEVSPEAVARVSEGAPWNPVAKEALIESLPAVVARWMNHFGVSAENRHEIALAGAVIAIAHGSYSLRKELRELALERRAREKRDKQSERREAPAPEQLKESNDGDEAKN